MGESIHWSPHATSSGRPHKRCRLAGIPGRLKGSRWTFLCKHPVEVSVATRGRSRGPPPAPYWGAWFGRSLTHGSSMSSVNIYKWSINFCQEDPHDRRFWFNSSNPKCYCSTLGALERVLYIVSTGSGPTPAGMRPGIWRSAPDPTEVPWSTGSLAASIHKSHERTVCECGPGHARVHTQSFCGVVWPLFLKYENLIFFCMSGRPPVCKPP